MPSGAVTIGLTETGNAADLVGVITVRRPRAGVYAQERYKRGLRAYRRRMRAPLLVVVAPMFVFFWFVVFSRHLDPWSLAAGAVVASAMGLVEYVRYGAPSHIQKWQRGAQGERRTEKALRPLERRGWSVVHDVPRDGRANLDHIVEGPRGVFLLETKNLSGTVAFEDGCLVARQFDDPDEVYRYKSLASRVRGQAVELSRRIQDQRGRAPWVQSVVVIWGDFPQGHVEDNKVVYIRGDDLRNWLATPPVS